MNIRRCFLLLCLLIFATCLEQTSRASDSRLYLIDQSDFGAKRGFYVDLENSSPGDAPCPLTSLKLILGVADGTQWRFFATMPVWQYGHDYAVKAVLDGSRARMYLDGTEVADAPCGFTPLGGDVTGDSMPSWAHGPADYIACETTMHLMAGTDKPVRCDFPVGILPIKLLVFEPQSPRRIVGFTPKPGQTVTLDATFRLVAAPTGLHSLAPLVDRYGQAAGGIWPSKVHSDSDLLTARLDEDRRLAAWAPSTQDYDRFGGWRKAGWHATATGYFRTVRHLGVWWLLSPAGNPCFYTGVCTAPLQDGDRTSVTGREEIFDSLPPKTGEYAAAWGTDPFQPTPGVDAVSFPTANLIRKYGPGWQSVFQARTAQRVRAWGFSGLGKWSGAVPGVPSLPVLSNGAPNLVRHPDIFDPEVRTAMTAALRTQITPRLTDPTVVGWTLGNEYDGIVTAAEVQTILAMPATVPAKKALVDNAVTAIYGGDIARTAAAWHVTASDLNGLYAATPTAPDTDLETLRRFYADRLYAVIYSTIKSIDPHHLYLGFWIVPGWWVNDEDWRMIARHCDVIGYDNYAPSFADDHLRRLMAETDKPTLCGEFSYPPQYDGARGFGLYDAAWSTDAVDAGRKYTRYVRAAAVSPYCVGVSWFEYRDEPLTGRGPGHGPDLIYGEHYAFGLVDVADQPRWDMITQMRRVNLDAPRLRAAAK